MVNITFYGVRGSTPSPCPCNGRYGGNTSCVVIERAGHDPLILDLGTGVRQYGAALAQRNGGAFSGTALVTHLHWDHVQGLPFFAPVLAPGARLHVIGPTPDDAPSLRDAFNSFLRPPFFPISIAEIPGDITFDQLDGAKTEIDDALITAVEVPHVGRTNGYRIDVDGVSIAYAPDHQQPGFQSNEVDQGVLDAFADVDVLIHDAQFTDDEFPDRATWGHCTHEYAVSVAVQCGARQLVLFHHDPTHDDDAVDGMLGEARVAAGCSGLEVISAGEGLTISLEPQVASQPADDLRAAG